MSDEDEKPTVAAPSGDRQAEPGSAGLPRPVQEHLGQQLRSAYIALDEKPAFLGDAAVPPELDRQLQRLETRERIRNKGLEAVRTALQGVDGSESTPPKAGWRQGR